MTVSNPPPAGASFDELILAQPSLVSYWPLGESAGAVAHDVGPGGNNGAYVGGVELGMPGMVAGDPSTSVGFDGSTAWVSVPDAPSLRPTTGLTVLAVAGTTSGNEQGIMGKTGAGVFSFGLYAQGLYGQVLTSGPVGVGIVPNAPVLLALTFDDSFVLGYINGAIVSRAVQAGPIAGNNNLPLYIGALAGNNNPFDGRLQKAAFFNTALNPAVITALAAKAGGG